MVLKFPLFHLAHHFLVELLRSFHRNLLGRARHCVCYHLFNHGISLLVDAGATEVLGLLCLDWCPLESICLLQIKARLVIICCILVVLPALFLLRGGLTVELVINSRPLLEITVVRGDLRFIDGDLLTCVKGFAAVSFLQNVGVLAAHLHVRVDGWNLYSELVWHANLGGNCSEIC